MFIEKLMHKTCNYLETNTESKFIGVDRLKTEEYAMTVLRNCLFQFYQPIIGTNENSVKNEIKEVQIII